MPALSKDLKLITRAIESGEKTAARKLLRPMLANNPTAEVWYLAARACEDDKHAIQCLRKALELEPLHSGANRMLFRIEGAKPQKPGEQPPLSALVTPVKEEDLEPLKKANRKRKRTTWQKIGCISGILLSLSSTLLVMGFLGSPIIGKALGVISGRPPVQEINGTPVEARPDAPVVVTPQQSRELQSGVANSDTLFGGYAHEYTYDARSGDELAILIQFDSPTAGSVSRNVAVLTPTGANAISSCELDHILQGDNGIALTCHVSQPGTWRVRIFGRDGESTGAYFISIDRLR
jgi:hypothetical protein